MSWVKWLLIKMWINALFSAHHTRCQPKHRYKIGSFPSFRSFAPVRPSGNRRDWAFCMGRPGSLCADLLRVFSIISSGKCRQNTSAPKTTATMWLSDTARRISENTFFPTTTSWFLPSFCCPVLWPWLHMLTYILIVILVPLIWMVHSIGPNVCMINRKRANGTEWLAVSDAHISCVW